jgi:flagellum-specific peptidoglycan hydrolase FlgJ
MIYKFDKDELLWKRNWRGVRITSFIVLGALVLSFLAGRYLKFNSLESFEKELIVLNIQAEKNKFTEEKLAAELKRLNVKHPHIVMAQSILETGHWKSKIFRENHNLFGMKQAGSRINTAAGTQHNHAYYETWIESIYDYAFYQCRYLGGIRTEAEYYAYLGNSYAEDPEYVKVVQSTVKKYKLKELFR